MNYNLRTLPTKFLSGPVNQVHVDQQEVVIRILVADYLVMIVYILFDMIYTYFPLYFVLKNPSLASIM